MKYVPKAITRTVGRTVLSAQNHSPAILFGAGLLGMATTIALATKATLHVEDVLVGHQKDMLEIERVESRDTTAVDQYYTRERQQVTLRTTGRLIKLYAPTAVAGVITITCLTTSHRQLTNRNAQITAAYVGLQRFLESYRGRVREEIGQEKERDVYYAATPVELVQDTDNGPVKYFGTKPGMRSPYSCMFDDSNPNFQDSSTFNEHFFRLQGEMLTNKLRSQGHLFLNEVYDRLACPRTPTGQVAGWALNHAQSDDFVEIRYTPIHDYHGSYMLDFNVAGHVLNMAFGVGEEG